MMPKASRSDYITALGAELADEESTFQFRFLTAIPDSPDTATTTDWGADAAALKSPLAEIDYAGAYDGTIESLVPYLSVLLLGVNFSGTIKGFLISTTAANGSSVRHVELFGQDYTLEGAADILNLMYRIDIDNTGKVTMPHTVMMS